MVETGIVLVLVVVLLAIEGAGRSRTRTRRTTRTIRRRRRASLRHQLSTHVPSTLPCCYSQLRTLSLFAPPFGPTAGSALAVPSGPKDQIATEPGTRRPVSG